MYQIRYVAYAKAHKMTPDEMFEQDKKQFPGGCMIGFILWICRKKSEFKKINQPAFRGDIIINNSLFDEYLLS